MANLSIKSIPDDLYEQLKVSAAAHHRSINSEVIVCLQRSLTSTRPEPEALLAHFATLRRRISVPPLTDAELSAAKSHGRQ